nr:hypothetical protein BaRGS_002173 [Batillaria attramentaria]
MSSHRASKNATTQIVCEQAPIGEDGMTMFHVKTLSPSRAFEKPQVYEVDAKINTNDDLPFHKTTVVREFSPDSLNDYVMMMVKKKMRILNREQRESGVRMSGYGGVPELMQDQPDLPGVYVGQNAAYGYRNWQTAIEAWHDEVSDFQYGKGAINDSVVGHYTQIVMGFCV